MLLGTRREGKKYWHFFENKLQLSLQRNDSVFDSIWPHGYLMMLYIQHCFTWITNCKFTNLQTVTVDTSHSGATVWHSRPNDTHTDKISEGKKSVICLCSFWSRNSYPHFSSTCALPSTFWTQAHRIWIARSGLSNSSAFVYVNTETRV